MTFSIQDRIVILRAIGDYITSSDIRWIEAKRRAEEINPWFIQSFIDLSCHSIAEHFLQEEILNEVQNKYNFSVPDPCQKIGIVMAGNLPLVGFHDFLAVVLSGHTAVMKLSSKDEVLWHSIIQFVHETFPESIECIEIASKLNDCQAYIATGGKNSNVYFKQYFGKYPHIIRGHRNGIAILDGNETDDELKGLADDMMLYFGMGCRNVTKLYVPANFDFTKLVHATAKYNFFEDHNKYRNNYDYQLALLMINNVYYMTSGVLLLVENSDIATQVSVVDYEYYENIEKVKSSLPMEQIQCIIGHDNIPFGQSQMPNIYDFADHVDTFQFCKDLK